jgi:isopentenyldiphosphate isomerase
MKITIVDEKDNILSSKERNSLTNKDIYRVSALWLTNNQNQILLAQRALNKKKDPRMWGPAVAGTVEENETYQQNIIKEAEEEIGLKNINPTKTIKTRIKKPHNHFTQWFTLKIKNKINLKLNSEVKQLKWFSKNELKKEIKEHPNNFVYSMRDVIEKL